MFLPPGFDKALANTCCDLIAQAYLQFDQRGAWVPPRGFLKELGAKPKGIFPTYEPFGFVCQDQVTKAIFVVFRGTRSVGDWLSDLSVAQCTGAHRAGWIEKGFWDLYAQMSVDMYVAVGMALNATPAAKVYVTGHSLGAAPALLGAYELADHRPTVYSFAGPRVGDSQFAVNFAKDVPDCWRIVNTEDIVPTVPPIQHFQHVPEPVCFTRATGTIVGNHGLAVYKDALR